MSKRVINLQQRAVDSVDVAAQWQAQREALRRAGECEVVGAVVDEDGAAEAGRHRQQRAEAEEEAGDTCEKGWMEAGRRLTAACGG